MTFLSGAFCGATAMFVSMMLVFIIVGGGDDDK